VENALKFNGILGKTEKYWEGGNNNIKEKETNKKSKQPKISEEKKKSANNSNINSTSYNSQSNFFIDDSSKDISLMISEEMKLNNLIGIIENKLGKFDNYNFFKKKKQLIIFIKLNFLGFKLSDSHIFGEDSIKLEDNKDKDKNLVNFDEFLNILLNSEKEDNKKSSNIKKSKKYYNKKNNKKSNLQLDKYQWNRLDDIKLIELTEKYGLDWQRISLIMEKPENLIKSRYEKRLDPNLKFTKFTPEEDSLIISKYKIYGGTWNNISKFLPNRNSIMIKNRFYSNLKKRLNDENFNFNNSHGNKTPYTNEIPYTFSNEFLNNDFEDKRKYLSNNNLISVLDENNSLSSVNANTFSVE